MSNRLEAKERVDTVFGVDVAAPIDRYQTMRRAEQLRAETLARMAGALWRWARAAGGRLLRSPAGVRGDAGLAELDDRTLADIGLTRDQIPGFVSREVEAARDVAIRTRSFRTPVSVA